VFILEGGLPKWKAEGRPIETGPARRAMKTFKAHTPPDVVAALPDVQSALASGAAQIVDARPADRFRGDAPEPRPGVRAGHIPGGLIANREFAECVVGYEGNVSEELITILFDPQTAGGLLISVAAETSSDLLRALNAAGVPAVEIGEVGPRVKPLITVEP